MIIFGNQFIIPICNYTLDDFIIRTAISEFCCNPLKFDVIYQQVKNIDWLKDSVYRLLKYKLGQKYLYSWYEIFL